MFIRTTAINKLLKLKKRISVVQGGTSAGKTFGIIPILIDVALKVPNKEISIVSESIPHLRRGAMKDFEKILKVTKRWSDKNFNKSVLKYIFNNNSFIEFFSTDQADKLRGARRDILYINEANNVNFEAYQQLSIRTNERIWLDFNPTHEFWVHTEILNDKDCEQVILTYQDNEALNESILNELLKNKEKAKTSKYWANWWNVYGLGKLGVLEGVIFDRWETIREIPKEAELMGVGIDFGYNDPTAIVGLYKVNNDFIFDEIAYVNRLVNSDIANILKQNNINRNAFIFADSAEPKSIREINQYGFNIKPCRKGRDSINFGIKIIQEHRFFVTEKSTNIINELRKYCWDTDKNGNRLDRPIDEYNHTIDAMRYVAIEKMTRKKKVKNKARLTDYFATV